VQRTVDKTPEVSVVLPVYRAYSRFLEEAIRSVLEQTEQSWELIVVEDGCPEKSAEPVRDWVSECRQAVRGVRLTENRGVGFARNVGLQCAAGKYVCFLDQDDAFYPRFMEVCKEVFRRYPDIDIVRVTPKVPVEMDQVRFDALTHSLMTTCLYSRPVLRSVGGWPVDAVFSESPYAGEDICLREVLETQFALRTITSVLYFHRCGIGNHTDRFLARSRVSNGRIELLEGLEWDRKVAEKIADKCAIARHRLFESDEAELDWLGRVDWEPMWED